MEESHVEGLAIHNDPESCTDGREAVGEALTGARAGWVLSHEISRAREPMPFSGQQATCSRQHARRGIPAGSETPRKRGTFLCENREICRPFTGRAVDRIGKAMAATR